MGFGREARRVRNTALPHAHRLHALGSCIQLTQPIGFNATWSYLEAKIGVPWRSTEFLIPAIDLLEAERNTHLRLDAEYAAIRRRQKRRGRRFPGREDATPKSPLRWHGDERMGAFHGLNTWRRLEQDGAVEAHTHGAVVLAAVDAVLNAPGVPDVDQGVLQQSLDWARRQVHVVGWDADHSEHRIAWVTLRLLGQLFLALNPPPAVGMPWNFVDQANAVTASNRVIASVLAEPIGLWRTAPLEGTPEPIDAATELLVRGFDSPTLRELAGASPKESQAIIEPLVTATLEELGATELMTGNAQRAALSARLRRYLDGRMTLREVSTWAHQTIGHDGDQECQPFVLLDDIYDDWEYAGHDLSRLEAIAKREAKAFIAGAPATGFDDLWPTEPATPEPNRRAMALMSRWANRFRRDR